MPTRRNYNPWGRKVWEIAARKGMDIEGVGERMRQMGYPFVAHPTHHLSRAMQKKHWKAITPALAYIVELALEADEEEVAELVAAQRETGIWAIREAWNQSEE